MMLTHTSPPQTLLFDADDTLWENNVYFERAITAFISYLDHRVHSAEEVRAHLNACERATIAKHGYGVKSFRKSLMRCFETLSEGPITSEKHGRIAAFTEAITAQEIELVPDVNSTLARLGQRHRLILVTKGDAEEQTGKLERSGLAALFFGVEVPGEKDEPMYRELVLKYELDTASSWMIGNSPRSDINPALAAGLHAVFIPHSSTWVLEHEALGEGGPGRQLLQLPRFRDLLRHF